MENKYNFKVYAELREDLTAEERAIAEKEISKWKERFSIIQIEDGAYCRPEKKEKFDDFGGVTIFFFKMRDTKQYFSKLEYHDYMGGDTIIEV